jgi:hypothetical protein
MSISGPTNFKHAGTVKMSNGAFNMDEIPPELKKVF